jgi:hypothetical protein
MVALLTYYFIFSIGAIALGLIMYKVFDKFIDIIADYIDSI